MLNEIGAVNESLARVNRTRSPGVSGALPVISSSLTTHLKSRLFASHQSKAAPPNRNNNASMLRTRSSDHDFKRVRRKKAPT